jgi:hypothetical protein
MVTQRAPGGGEERRSGPSSRRIRPMVDDLIVRIKRILSMLARPGPVCEYSWRAATSSIVDNRSAPWSYTKVDWVSAPTAELPVVDLDICEGAKPRPLVLDERIDSVAIRCLKGQSNSDRLGTIECRECSV